MKNLKIKSRKARLIFPLCVVLLSLLTICCNDELKVDKETFFPPKADEESRFDIFYPDSASRRRIFTRRNINQEEELEISGAGVYMKVHIEDNNGFSISDWRVFYNCLYDLIKLFEDERNKISLKIWDKDYDSLSFQEKEKIVDLAGYRINIEFK